MTEICSRARVALFLVLVACMQGIQAQTYDELWKKVDEYVEQDLPQSALKQVQRIADKAGRDKHPGQMLAAFMTERRLSQQVVPDKFFTHIVELDKMRSQAASKGNQPLYALCSALQGQILEQRMPGTDNHDTDFPQTDLSLLPEWSRTDYTTAAGRCYEEALSCPEALAAARQADYLPGVLAADDDRYFQHDLLHVVAREVLVNDGRYGAVRGRRRDSLFHRVIDVYRRQGNMEAELLMILDSIGQRQVAVPISLVQDTAAHHDVTLYRALLDRFGHLPLCAEVYRRLSELNAPPALQCAWAQEGATRYAGTPGAAVLRARVQSLQNPYYKLTAASAVIGGEACSLEVEHRALAGATLLWYRMPDAEVTAAQGRDGGADRIKHYKELMNRQQPVQRDVLCLRQGLPCDVLTDTLALRAPAPGLYLLRLQTDAGVESPERAIQVAVSRLRLLSAQLPWGQVLFRVVDAQTGAPVPQATVQVYQADKCVGEYLTDDAGKVQVGNDQWGYPRWNMTARAIKGNDCAMWRQRIEVYHDSRDNGEHQEVYLYTDRAAYRPGQTVQVAGLCVRRAADGTVGVWSHAVMELQLRDAQYKTVASTQVAADEMGKFTATFVLPQRILSGRFSLKAEDYGYGTLLVEEYKLPTYALTLDPVDDTDPHGDSVRVSGRCAGYNGVPMVGARVVAETAQPARHDVGYRYGADEEETDTPVWADTVQTDETGCFVLSVPRYGAYSPKVWWGAGQELKVTACNRAGESHEARLYIPLGRRTLRLQLDMPQYCERGQLPVLKPRVTTPSGVVVQPDALTLSVYAADDGQLRQPLVNGLPFPLQSAVLPQEVAALPSGRYQLKAEAICGGDTVSTCSPFILFSLSDQRPPAGMDLFAYCTTDTIDSGQPARIRVGSSLQDVHLYVQVIANQRLLSDRIISLSNALTDVVVDGKDVDSSGAQVLCYLMQGGQLRMWSHQLVRRRPSRRLQLHWTTFRNRLVPGQSETWRLRVLQPDGRPAPAQLMAVLYDAALDQIARHRWAAPVLPWQPVCPEVSLRAPYINNVYLYGSKPLKGVKEQTWTFGHFDAERLLWPSRRYPVYPLLMANGAAPRTLQAKSALTMDAVSAVESEEVVEETAAAPKWAERQTEGAGTTPAVPATAVLRSHLVETAFFYPRLMTNDRGEADLQFTLPESLTTWRFMAVAHTRDLLLGDLQDEVVAQKPVMAELRLPRFVRQADSTQLQAAVSNLTDRVLAAQVRMELCDPLTQAVLWQAQREVELPVHADTVLHFGYVAGAGQQLPVCRVWVEADGHTDGEQRYLPVLSNRQQVVETIPFEVDAPADTTLQLNSLFAHHHAQAADRSLTIDYTAGTLWYALSALPTLLGEDPEDALSVSVALYALDKSAALMERYPYMTTAFTDWRRRLGDELQGRLSRSEQLLGILPQEMPWADETLRETRHLNRLADLCDPNVRQEHHTRLMQRLAALQQADGSFCWFKGMSGSFYISRLVAMMLWRTPGDLYQGIDADRLLAYLVGEMEQMVKKDKEWRSKKQGGYPVTTWIDHLEVLVQADAVNANKALVRYMTERVLKERNRLPLPTKAVAAVLLDRLGHHDKAMGLARSLREHLVTDPSGIHISYPMNSRWSTATKIGVQCRLMEALRALPNGDDAEARGLCRWLLAQRRAQAWDSPVATVEAVEALLAVQGAEVPLVHDDRLTLRTPQGTEVQLDAVQSEWAGLGRLTATVPDGALQGGAGTLQVCRSQGEQSAWGMVMARYTLPADAVQADTASLAVRCEPQQTTLQCGDRLKVRYVVEASQDCDCVRLRLGRAACMEPVAAFSGYRWQGGLGCYREVKDAYTHLYFDRMPRGVYVFEEEYYIERAGRYCLPAAEVHCIMAPEYAGHSAPVILQVRP